MIPRWLGVWSATFLAVLAMVVSAEPIVFFEGEPFGAAVKDEAGTTLGVTPFLRVLPVGDYRITFERDGHRSVTESFSVSDDDVFAVNPTLPARYTIIDLPQEGRNDEVLPDGSYRFTRDEGAFGIEPIYPGETRLRVFRTATPVLIGAAIASTVWTAVAPPQSTDAAIVPTVVLQVGALTSAGLSFRENRRRDLFFEEWTPPVQPYRPLSAAALADEARAATVSGDLAQARERYTRLINEFPYAPSVPEALYTLGRFDLIDRSYADAAVSFQRLRTDYPVIEYYDRTLLQLARIAFEEGDSEGAEGYLELITGSDPSVDGASVEALRSMFAE